MTVGELCDLAKSDSSIFAKGPVILTILQVYPIDEEYEQELVAKKLMVFVFKVLIVQLVFSSTAI